MSSSKPVVLVIGAGTLAENVVDYLSKRNYHIRVVIRNTSKVDKFKDKAEVFVGSIVDKEFVKKAFVGVNTVISIVGNAELPGPLIEQNEIIGLAKEAGVTHFIPTLFSPRLSDAPKGVLEDFFSAKEEGLRRVKESGMKWTALYAGLFTEVWVDYVFNFSKATAKIPGEGKNVVPWLTYQDIAQYIALSVQNSSSINKEFFLGSENLSYSQVIDIVQQRTNKKFEITYTTVPQLVEEYHKINDENDKDDKKGITGLYATVAQLGPADLIALQEAYPDFKITETVSQYVEKLAKK